MTEEARLGGYCQTQPVRASQEPLSPDVLQAGGFPAQVVLQVQPTPVHVDSLPWRQHESANPSHSQPQVSS